MLNRHAVVLLLGNAAILLLRPYPSAAFGTLGMAFLALLLGLLLDPGREGLQAVAALLLQASGLLALLVSVAQSIRLHPSEPHFLLAMTGIFLAVMGALLEQVLKYRFLRVGIATQALGDGFYLAAFLLALLARTQRPSAIGWAFIALAGTLSTYAALYNLVLQIRRLKDLQAGWRYRVVAHGPDGLRVRTPRGEELIPWRDIQKIQRMDRRHLVLMLPAPLPDRFAESELPWEELRASPEPSPESKAPPEGYGLILHEQELGCALAEAELSLRRHLEHRTSSAL